MPKRRGHRWSTANVAKLGVKLSAKLIKMATNQLCMHWLVNPPTLGLHMRSRYRYFIISRHKSASPSPRS